MSKNVKEQEVLALKASTYFYRVYVEESLYDSVYEHIIINIVTGTIGRTAAVEI